ncbi:hypothetical protein H9P43_006403 [Blastocladiella emersonii ATCC 22665]|nr:hypothetical protein H9P43_006403 [Blastocladiella emersonii ATCC 22665]
MLPVHDTSGHGDDDDAELLAGLPPPPRMRWVVLSTTCFVLVGNFYAYDQVAALNIPLEEYSGLPATEYQYLIGSFFVVYSLPNIVLPFIGGALIDKYGARTIAVVTSLLSVVGQLFFTIGLVSRTPSWAVFGRFLFGLGGETLSVSQQRITTKWFRGSELALAVGINLAVARLGSVVNDLISPYLAHHYDVPTALWTGFLTCLLSLTSTVFLVLLDAKNAHICPETVLANHRAMRLHDLSGSGSRGTPKPLDGDGRAALLARTPRTAGEEQAGGGDPANWPHGFNAWSLVKRELWVLQRGVRAFPRVFWLIQLSMIFQYGTVIPFNTIHAAFLTYKWYPTDPQHAAQVMGVPDTLSALLVPFAGTFFDRRGHRAHAIVLSACIICFAHFILGAVPTSVVASPIPVLMVLGSSYALLLTFVPCIPLVVPDAFLGTAYGINTSLANFAWTVFPVVVAGLSAADPTYYSTEMLFSVSGLIAIFIGLYINHLDKRDHGGVLNLPARPDGIAPGGSSSARVAAAAGETLWEAVPTRDLDDDLESHLHRSRQGTGGGGVTATAAAKSAPGTSPHQRVVTVAAANPAGSMATLARDHHAAAGAALLNASADGGAGSDSDGWGAWGYDDDDEEAEGGASVVRL